VFCGSKHLSEWTNIVRGYFLWIVPIVLMQKNILDVSETNSVLAFRWMQSY